MKKLIPLLTASLFLMGCLESPLLNHATASPQAAAPAADPAEKALARACPLAFPAQKLCASLTWVRMPADEDKGEFTMRFWKQDEGTESGPYVNPSYKVAVKLSMPTMGHGSSPVTVTQAVDQAGASIPGVFRATDVYFVMGGSWEIWVQLKENRQVIEQAKVDIEI